MIYVFWEIIDWMWERAKERKCYVVDLSRFPLASWCGAFELEWVYMTISSISCHENDHRHRRINRKHANNTHIYTAHYTHTYEGEQDQVVWMEKEATSYGCGRWVGIVAVHFPRKTFINHQHWIPCYSISYSSPTHINNIGANVICQITWQIFINEFHLQYAHRTRSYIVIIINSTYAPLAVCTLRPTMSYVRKIQGRIYPKDERSIRLTPKNSKYSTGT